MVFKLIVLCCSLLCLEAAGQLFHPVSNMPSYSVVSIHQSDPSETEPHGSVTQDSYQAERTTIRDVLAYAFGLGYEQELINAPAWVLNERFDVQAKLDGDQLTEFRKLNRDQREEQMRLMMQSALAERLQLTYHFGTRTLSVFELQVAKSGFKCPADTTSPPAIADPTRPHSVGTTHRLRRHLHGMHHGP